MTHEEGREFLKIAPGLATRFARRLGEHRTPDVAQDILDRALLRALRAPAFDGRGAFSTWVGMFVSRAASDHARDASAAYKRSIRLISLDDLSPAELALSGGR